MPLQHSIVHIKLPTSPLLPRNEPRFLTGRAIFCVFHLDRHLQAVNSDNSNPGWYSAWLCSSTVTVCPHRSHDPSHCIIDNVTLTPSVPTECAPENTEPTEPSVTPADRLNSSPAPEHFYIVIFPMRKYLPLCQLQIPRDSPLKTPTIINTMSWNWHDFPFLITHMTLQ